MARLACIEDPCSAAVDLRKVAVDLVLLVEDMEVGPLYSPSC